MSAFALVVAAAVGGILIYQILVNIRKRWSTTRLSGPKSDSIIFGVMNTIGNSPDPGSLYENWEDSYGTAYQIPGLIGTTRLVLCDPQAVAHVYALDSWKYGHTALARKQLASLTGKLGLLSILGEEHKRQRRILSPVFTLKAVKSYSPIFFDSVYKIKTAWDDIMQFSNEEEAIIDVGEWMSRLSLDVIGLAGFSHDFGHLNGRTSPVAEAMTALAEFRPSRTAMLILLLAQIFPSLMLLPSPRKELVARLSTGMAAIGDSLLQKARLHDNVDKSALGILLKAENAELSEAEVKTHLVSILLAGNETTAVSLKWAFIHLAMNPDKQAALRAELSALRTLDPSFEDLANGLPYLDAVVREVIRLHPLGETTRVALENDIVPLAYPVKNVRGEKIDKVMIGKGTTVILPVHTLNCATSIWGENAKEFLPERWLNEGKIPQRAKEYTGYHHILTFVDGPRTCLGKNFALIEIKVALAVLIRHFKFLPRDGPQTSYSQIRRVIRHPKVSGEEGARLPMRVSRVG